MTDEKHFLDDVGLAHLLTKLAKKEHTHTPESIGALKTYTSLTDLGLSGAVTMEQVCVALPDCSMLLYGNTVADASGNYIADVPSNFGTVEVVRYNVSRISAQFVKGDDTSVKMWIGKYHGDTGWTGWLSVVHTLESLGAQAQHYYYEPTDFGCTTASTPAEIWNAMPDHSAFVYPSASLTSEEWNFPSELGVVRIEKYAVNRGVIEYFGKGDTTNDYRMYLDLTTGDPSGVWHSYYTSANKPSAPDISAVPWTLSYADTFETFWADIYKAADTMGMVAFRLKDTGGWGPTQTANTWHNGIAFWQNPPSSEDNVNALILLRVNSPDNEILYKGAVSGNDASGYTLSWARMYDAINKPTAAEVGALNLKPPFIEITPDTTADNGGYIDFHYAGSTKDYTARIIEAQEGRLEVTAPEGFVVSHNLRVNQELKIPELSDNTKGSRVYCSEGLGLSYLEDPLDTNSPRTGLKINVPSAELATLIRVFIATEAGDAKWYNLYGEHNKPTPADIGAAASSHNQAASTITAGTFAGQVVANSSGQTPGTSLLRNSKLVSAETNPTVNGEICWTYE